MFKNTQRLEDQGVVMLLRSQVRGWGDLQELGYSYEFTFVDVHGEVLENVVGAEASCVFSSLCIFQESPNTLFEFLVVYTKFFMNHCDDLIVVLNTQQHILQACQSLPV